MTLSGNTIAFGTGAIAPDTVLSHSADGLNITAGKTFRADGIGGNATDIIGTTIPIP